MSCKHRTVYDDYQLATKDRWIADSYHLREANFSNAAKACKTHTIGTPKLRENPEWTYRDEWLRGCVCSRR